MIFNNLDTYLAEFIGDMRDRVEQTFEPLYDPGRTPLSDEVIDLVRCPMAPYPAQAVTTEAISRAFGTGKVVIANGETGVGKTGLALWTVISALQKHRLKRPASVILTCPNQLTKKWKRHAEKIIPGCRATIIRSWRDILPLRQKSYVVTKTIKHKDGSISIQQSKRWIKPDRTEILIVPRDRGKLGYSWRNGAVGATKGTMIHKVGYPKPVLAKTHVYRCPKCGHVITDPDNGVEVGPEYFMTKSGKLSHRRKCTRLRSLKHAYRQSRRDENKAAKRPHLQCGEPLHQAFNGQSSRWADPMLPMPGVSPKRVAPCNLLKRFGARFDLYACDEAHELRGEGSLQGQMLADISRVSDRQLLLTGTLIGGYATNLLYLLWRTMAPRMVEAGLTHDKKGEDQYISTYGVLREETRYTATSLSQSHEDLVLGRGKVKRSKRTKAMPGISPLAFVHFLLDRTVFLRLREMHEHLPKFEEKVHTLPFDQDVDHLLNLMQAEFEDHRRRHRPCRAWSAARAVFLRWPDKPHVAPYWVMDKDDLGLPVPAFYVRSLPKKERAKERRIRRLIVRNKLRGRKTWVFTELTGQGNQPEWDIMADLAEYLKQHGIRTAVLRAEAQGGPKPEDREAWIEKVAPTVDCVISSPILVQTGLDLFDFPSIIFAYCGYNTYVLRQASRRAWRLGQSMSCEVDYLIYGGRFAVQRSMTMTEDGGDEVGNHDASRDVIIERVRKLMALASDPAASPGESDNAMRFAEKLIDEHDIRMEEISGGTPNGKPSLVEVECYRLVKSKSRSVQAAALSLMATKLEASLAIEGDFSAEGLAAMSGGEDIATQLARFIDGKLDDLEPASTAFERYRRKLEQVMPELGKAMKEESECKNRRSQSSTRSGASASASSSHPGAKTAEGNGTVRHGSTEESVGSQWPSSTKAEPTPGSGHSTTTEDHLGCSPSSASNHRGRENSTSNTPTPSSSTEKSPSSDEYSTDSAGKFSLTKSLGISPAPVKPAREDKSGASIFERPSQIVAEEPAGIRERRQYRLAALSSAIGQPVVQSDGDRHRFGDTWFHLVAKRRETVRDRNFAATAEQYPDAWIAFVEPIDQVGPTTSSVEARVGEIKYVISTMPLSDYMNGERTPGGLPEIVRA